jgi:hypothetical protein
MFSGLFFEFLTPFTFGGHKIFNSILILMIFSVSNVPIGGVRVLFGH